MQPVAPVTDTGNYRVVNIEDKEGPLGDKVEVGPFVKPEYVHDVRSTAPEVRFIGQPDCRVLWCLRACDPPPCPLFEAYEIPCWCRRW
jgi:hypothetical protein